MNVSQTSIYTERSLVSQGENSYVPSKQDDKPLESALLWRRGKSYVKANPIAFTTYLVSLA